LKLSPKNNLHSLDSLQDDFHFIEKHYPFALDAFAQKTFFLTGGTGFMGKWLLSFLSYLEETYHLDLKIWVVSRNPDAFLKDYPVFKKPFIQFSQGDIRNFSYPKTAIDYVIHGATEASRHLNETNPQEMYDVIVEGTKRILDFSKQKKIRCFLNLSSGAVYGAQPPSVKKVPETYLGAPGLQDMKSAYGHGKRVSEWLSTLSFHQHQVPVIQARCFAFVGPFLPLQTHFAVGNFMLNAMNGEKILIKGDGTPLRSYLYSAELVGQLLKLLFSQEFGQAFNIGSSKSVSIRELAETVSEVWNTKFAKVRGLPKVKPQILQKPNKNKPLESYVPLTTKFEKSFQLKQKLGLNEALTRTFKFYLGGLDQ